MRRLLLAAIAALPTLAQAQLLSVKPIDTLPPRQFVGFNFIVGQPLNEFSDIIDAGFGGSGHYRFNLDRQGVLGIRVDASFLNYDNEKLRVCGLTYNCRVQVDVHTSNNIVDMTVGPQLTVPSRFIQPYVNAGIGYSYFFTESSVSGSDDTNGDYASTTNFDDGGFSWNGSGGLLIPVSHGRVPVAIDLAARYHSNGQRSYLKKGSIEDNGPGQLPTLHPIRSQANLVTYHLGVSIGIPRGGHRDHDSDRNR
jgi:hypothetical protein